MLTAGKSSFSVTLLVALIRSSFKNLGSCCHVHVFGTSCAASGKCSPCSLIGCLSKVGMVHAAWIIYILIYFIYAIRNRKKMCLRGVKAISTKMIYPGQSPSPKVGTTPVSLYSRVNTEYDFDSRCSATTGSQPYCWQRCSCASVRRKSCSVLASIYIYNIVLSLLFFSYSAMTLALKKFSSEILSDPAFLQLPEVHE